jgi:hypothetical protein
MEEAYHILTEYTISNRITLFKGVFAIAENREKRVDIALVQREIHHILTLSQPFQHSLFDRIKANRRISIFHISIK